jgi:hypothetical protein
MDNKNIRKLFSAERNEKEHILNDLIYNSWTENPILFLKLLYFMRDARCGKGEKNISYLMLKFLKNNFPKTYAMNIGNIALEYGCIKDLLIMAKYNITDESVVNNVELNILASLLKEDLERDIPSLAVKWAPREKSQYKEQTIILSKILFPDSNNNLERYRKEIICQLNKKINIVEHDMCLNNWDNIDYSNVPYLSLKKYFTSFYIHSPEKFQKFLESKKRIKNLNINIKQYKDIVKKMNDDYDINDDIENILNKYKVYYDNDEINNSFDDNNKQDLLDYLNFSKKNKNNRYILVEKHEENIIDNQDDWVIF